MVIRIRTITDNIKISQFVGDSRLWCMSPRKAVTKVHKAQKKVENWSKTCSFPTNPFKFQVIPFSQNNLKQNLKNME